MAGQCACNTKTAIGEGGMEGWREGGREEEDACNTKTARAKGETEGRWEGGRKGGCVFYKDSDSKIAG